MAANHAARWRMPALAELDGRLAQWLLVLWGYWVDKHRQALRD